MTWKSETWYHLTPRGANICAGGTSRHLKDLSHLDREVLEYLAYTSEIPFHGEETWEDVDSIVSHTGFEAGDVQRSLDKMASTSYQYVEKTTGGVRD